MYYKWRGNQKHFQWTNGKSSIFSVRICKIFKIIKINKVEILKITYLSNLLTCSGNGPFSPLGQIMSALGTRWQHVMQMPTICINPGIKNRSSFWLKESLKSIKNTPFVTLS